MYCQNCPYARQYYYAMNTPQYGTYYFQQPIPLSYYAQGTMNPPMSTAIPTVEEQGNPANQVEEVNSVAFSKQFLNEDGQLDVNKMLSTVGQLAQTVQQVSPVIKQVNDIIQSFRP